MKKSLVVMLAVLSLVIVSCARNFGNGVLSQLIPSDIIEKAKYPQQPFDKVDNHVVGNIRVIQSDQSRVTLSAPENYIDLFEFNNENGCLNICFTHDPVNINGKDVTILIYTPTLKTFENSGAATISIDSLVTDDFNVKNSGVGSFYLTNISVKRVDVSCSGVGSISISGQAEEGEYSCSGVGSIHAHEMKARSAKANVSGVGSIECYASERIKGAVTGIGSLKYGGRPAERSFNKPKVGSIHEM